MPTFYKQTWKDYTIAATNSSFIRQLMKFYSFGANTELLPYFYSTLICFDLSLIRHKKTHDKQLRYEWQLIKSVEKEAIDSYKGDGVIKVSKITTRNWKNNAVHVGRIPKAGQYKVQLKLSNEIEASSYMDIAEFTIKDKDEFGAQLLWILVSALIGAIVGAVIGTAVP
jgi:hypothetical protein